MFILVGFDSDTRNSTVEKFASKEDAWREMLYELRNVNNEQFYEDYKNDADDSGFVENAEHYGIDGNNAWANGGNDVNYDWSIHLIA